MLENLNPTFGPSRAEVMKTLPVVRFLLITVVLVCGEIAVAQERPDSIALPEESQASATAEPLEAPADSVASQKVSSTLWIKQLFKNGFKINDPGVDYPKFPRFLRDVYNWGDHTFNSYDTTYVVGTGKNWKLQAKSFNWIEAVTMQFPDNRIWMHTHLYADAGFSLSFMAVSLGYTWNVNEILGHPTHRSSFSFDFTCSRFTVSLLSQKTSGDMTITRFGHYNDGHEVNIPFNDADISSLSLDAFYFFNNKKFSWAAAYCFSKYQRKSAGTWMAGFNYDHKNIRFDFSKLSINVPDDTRELLTAYRFNYKDYQLGGGYSYNWAFPHHWTLNATGLLTMGYRQSFEDSGNGYRSMLANSMRAQAGVTYNHRALFAAANLKFRGSFFYTANFIFFNYNTSFSFNIGMRF